MIGLSINIIIGVFVLIIAIPLYKFLKYVLEKYTQASGKNIKILTIVFVIIGTPIIFIIAIVALLYVVKSLNGSF